MRVHALKQATVLQFINKNHVELDMDEVEPDIAYMMDIIQTVT